MPLPHCYRPTTIAHLVPVPHNPVNGAIPVRSPVLPSRQRGETTGEHAMHVPKSTHLPMPFAATLPSTRHAALALAAQESLNATHASGVQTALPLPNVIRMTIDNWDVLRDVGEFPDPDGRQQSTGPHVVADEDVRYLLCVVMRAPRGQ